MHDPPVLRVEGLRKQFGAIHALGGIDLTVERGEVHGLVGANGSGKSTLVKILTGVYRPDAGSVQLWGDDVHLPITSPKHHGISVVHQDLGLVDQLSILDNVGVVDSFGARLLAPINNRRLRTEVQRLADDLQLEFDVEQQVAELSPSERALVGLLRATYHIGYPNADCLLILDEPTAYLPSPEAARVVEVMRTIAANGSAVIFISHRLSEVVASTSRVSVMRNGHLERTLEARAATERELVALMLGRQMDEFYPERHVVEASDREPLLHAEGISGEVVRDFDLVAHPGEIVGVTGLVGMGQDEVPYLLGGARPFTSGTVTVGGERVHRLTPNRCRQLGVALIPGHRLREGLWADASIAENVSLPVVRSLGTRWRRSDSAERSLGRTWIERLSIKAPNENVPATSLSGGNQQKVVFAKWLNVAPSVLILHEPTQGVDAGAKREVLDLIMSKVDDGGCVVMCSGDHEELAAVCDRVLVMYEGQIVGELLQPTLTTDRLIEYCQRRAPVAPAS